jgi:long-subunit fatty acid transport protein
MKRSVATLAVAAAAALVAGDASAQAVQNIVLRNSFNPLGAGARGLGMGGAFIGVADDGTAASFNPAGLAQLRRTELALVGFNDEVRSTLTVPRRQGIETSRTVARHYRPDFIGLSVPFEVDGKSLTVELSYQRAVDLFGRGGATVLDRRHLTDLDPDLPPTIADIIGRITPAASGAFHTAGLSAGYQLTSRLAVGASLNYWIARWTIHGQSDFHILIADAEFPLLHTDFDEQQRFQALGANFGMLLKYSRLSVGAVVRLPFTADYTLLEDSRQLDFIHTDVKGNPLVDPLAFQVKSRLHWPRSAGVGIALRPFKGMTLAGDYVRSQWSGSFIEDVPSGALLTARQTGPDGTPLESFTNRNFFDLLPATQTATEDTDQWRAGGEYLVVLPGIIVPLRGGYFRDRSPIVDLGADRGRLIKGFTVGAGVNFKQLALDVAFERRRSAGNVSLRLLEGERVSAGRPSTETVREDRVVASLIYRAGGPDDALKRLFRFLFVGSREGQGGGS